MAASAANGDGHGTGKTYPVKGGSVVGTAKEICVLRGSWLSGERFRYQAWDRCADLKVRRISVAEADRDIKQRPQTPIVAASDFIEISNAYSRVLIFPKEDGLVGEVTLAD